MFRSGKCLKNITLLMFWMSLQVIYHGSYMTDKQKDDIFSSFITDEISDFNSNVYYTNPDYLRCSYLEGKMLA